MHALKTMQVNKVFFDCCAVDRNGMEEATGRNNNSNMTLIYQMSAHQHCLKLLGQKNQNTLVVNLH